jgi:hypothetical protein
MLIYIGHRYVVEHTRDFKSPKCGGGSVVKSTGWYQTVTLQSWVRIRRRPCVSKKGKKNYIFKKELHTVYLGMISEKKISL